MAGVIRADGRGDGRRCECGGKFVRRKRRDFRNEVPVCESCGDTPPNYVIRVTLPGKPKADIRYTIEGERLTTASAADQTLEQIRKSIEDGSFDPLKYLGRGQREEFRFRNFAAYYLKTRREDPDPKKRLTPGGEAVIQSLLTHYLLPHFGNVFIQDITQTAIQRFSIDWRAVGKAKTTRQRGKCLEALRSILTFARKLGFLRELPVFPDIEKAAKNRDWIPLDVQQAIIDLIPDPDRAAIEISRLFLARPGEVEALRWKDIEFDRRVIHFRRHFSKGRTEIAGRKSIKDPTHAFYDHQHSFGDSFLEVIRRLPRSLNPEDLVFRSSVGERFSERRLYKAWIQALEAYNEERRKKRLPEYRISLYRGIRASTAQALSEDGKLTGDQARIMLGHSSSAATDHYRQETARSLRGLVEQAIGGAAGVQGDEGASKTAEKGFETT